MKRKRLIFLITFAILMASTAIWAVGNLTVEIKDMQGNDISISEGTGAHIWGYILIWNGSSYDGAWTDESEYGNFEGTTSLVNGTVTVNLLRDDIMSHFGLSDPEHPNKLFIHIIVSPGIDYEGETTIAFAGPNWEGDYPTGGELENKDVLWGFGKYDGNYDDMTWQTKVNTVNLSSPMVTPNGIYVEGDFNFIDDINITINESYPGIPNQIDDRSTVDIDRWTNYGCTVTSQFVEQGDENNYVEISNPYFENGTSYRLCNYFGLTQISTMRYDNSDDCSTGYVLEDLQRMYIDVDYQALHWNDEYSSSWLNHGIYDTYGVSEGDIVYPQLNTITRLQNDYLTYNTSISSKLGGYTALFINPVRVAAPLHIPNEATVNDTGWFYYDEVIDMAVSENTIEVCKGYHETTNVSIDKNLTFEVVDEELVSRTETIIDGNITVTNSADLTISDVHITGTLDNTAGGTVIATHCYWGDATGPAAGDIVGTVSYVPWYTDAEMNTLGYPVPDLTMTFDGTNATLTWTDEGFTYKVYGTNNPAAAFPGEWISLSVDAFSGSNWGNTYQFYAVMANDWNESVAKVGYFEYALKRNDIGNNLLSLCLDYGYTTAEELGTALGLEYHDEVDSPYGETLSIWDSATQSWITSTMGPNGSFDPPMDLETGMVLNIVIGETDRSGYLIGEIPENWASFDFVTTTTTDMNLVYLPLNYYGTSYDTIGEVGATIGNENASSISIWNSTNQGWETTSYLSLWEYWVNGDVSVNIGQPLMIGANQDFTWPNN